jgi:molybdenum cofactor biosynthesis enzyme MoaA
MLLKDINLRVAVSSRCNLNCIYCEGSAGYKPGKPGAMEDFRKAPIEYGNIDTKTLLDIIKLFHKEGFVGLTLTGGEPLLNKDWDKIVRVVSDIGMTRVEMTTNGILLENYLKENGSLPSGLTLIKISLDTVDPIRFKEITRGGDLNKVIKAVKKISPHVKMRANKVLLKSDLDSLLDYFDFCYKTGFQEVSLLDLVMYSNRDNPQEKDFFEKEYVSFDKIRKFFLKKLGIDFNNYHKYGHAIFLPNGLKIIMKDSDVAVRNKNCINCPVYCQEGIYTVRIATDGNITACPDFKAELPSIDGLTELKNGTLSGKIKQLVLANNSAKKIDSFKNYAKRHSINFKN